MLYCVVLCCSYAFPLLVLMAGVCYSVLAPVILLFVLAYFAIAYVVWLNQLLYVYNIPTNTGGTQARHSRTLCFETTTTPGPETGRQTFSPPRALSSLTCPPPLPVLCPQWPAVFRCCMIILAIFQALVTGVLGLKKMALATSLMLPLLAATLFFSHNIDQ